MEVIGFEPTKPKGTRFTVSHLSPSMLHFHSVFRFRSETLRLLELVRRFLHEVPSSKVYLTISDLLFARSDASGIGINPNYHFPYTPLD